MEESKVTSAHDVAGRHTLNSNERGIITAGILIASALDRLAARLPAPKLEERLNRAIGKIINEMPAAPKAKKAAKETPEGFQSFWDVWPKKVARPAAEKAWRALSPSPGLAAIIRANVGLRMLSKDWRKNNGEFIPHPATYINGRRWEDEGTNTNNEAAFVGDKGTHTW